MVKLAENEGGGGVGSAIWMVAILVIAVLALSFLKPDLGAMLSNLQGVGFFNAILPFALIFAITYAFVTSTKIAEGWVAAVIAIVVAFFALLFLSTISGVAAFFAYVFGRLGILLVLLMLILLVVGSLNKFGGGK